MDPLILFHVAALILSVVLHEAAHGYAANALGDPTARLQGRLTLNPISHIDPLGSVILPGLLIITGSSILFGWAKPVPYNPYNLRGGRWGEALVAGAGPGVNFLLALIFGILIRFSGALGLSATFVGLAAFIVYLNILLAIFNLIPFPPLDGSKILKALLPYRTAHSFGRLEERLFMMGPFVAFGGVLILAYLLWPVIAALINVIFGAIVGSSVYL